MCVSVSDTGGMHKVPVTISCRINRVLMELHAAVALAQVSLERVPKEG